LKAVHLENIILSGAVKVAFDYWKQYNYGTFLDVAGKINCLVDKEIVLFS
jgi:hypothetical protein